MLKKKYRLISAVQRQREDIVEFLINSNADINQKAKSKAPLEFAVDSNIAILKKLCEVGASLDNLDEHNNTIFHLMAAKNYSEKKFETILIHGHSNSNNEIINNEEYGDLRLNIFLLKSLFKQKKFL